MKKAALAIILSVSVLFGLMLSGCSQNRDDEQKEPIKDIKSTVFTYKGTNYNIIDFYLSGWIEMKDEESQDHSVRVNYMDLSSAPIEMIEVKYWYEFEKTGYPCIEVLWDAEKVIGFGAEIYSVDGKCIFPFSGENGLQHRAKAISGSDAGSSEGIYFFAEPEDLLAEEEIDNTAEIEEKRAAAKHYDNPVLECGENEAAAYIGYEDESRVYFYEYNGLPCTLRSENVKITGEGDYSVGLYCDTEIKNTAYAALCIDNGEEIFPGYYYTITAITVNGKPINFASAYNCADEDMNVYSYIFNPKVEFIDDNARCAYRSVDECSPMIVGNRIRDWTELRVYFTVTAPETKFIYEQKKAEIEKQLTEEQPS